jgi:RHS repeat-associated protein
MTCRAPTSSTTCAGTQTGAQLSYDNEGRLAAWQNQPTSPTSTDSFLYDGSGQRVEQQLTSGGTTTTSVYVGNAEEISTTSGTTTTTTYYYAGGMRLALAVNGTFSYLGSDGAGSAEVALDGNGNVQASTLYTPYGGTRYSSGTMPGSYAFTGQRADGTTGLDYYNARYYDPVANQFISADTQDDGLNRHGYVGDNPETNMGH